MESAEDPAVFPIVRCGVCATEVLGYLDLDEHGRPITRCLGCSTTADAAAIRFGDERAIAAIGWGYVLPEAECGRSGCGRGRCVTVR
ncbi:MAG: hypothetical protein B6D46_12115 [Polyangiaceae bacterium UTPRO1]|jgi:hypothetical protein|nr:hypothetical protein [Myxococcales bacterium]OQY65969.1 MAG: hypothetical protein B6D46_12115 [Polyangiaceae bacterium UTPRO1]